MLLKLHVAPDVLSLYDVSPAAPGVAADVSHINTKGKVGGGSPAGVRVCVRVAGADHVAPRAPRHVAACGSVFG